MMRESDDGRECRRLVERVREQGGRITAGQLRHSSDTKYPTAEAAALALEGLAQAGLGEWEDVPAGPRGGRPTRRFVLRDLAATTAETAETTEPEG